MKKPLSAIAGVFLITSVACSLLLVMGCIGTPKPFEIGERTTAPYGYTEMIKREAK